LAFLADDAGDAGEESEEIERGVLGEGCGMEVPGAFYLTANCFVELTDCHRCVDFVLVILAGASVRECTSDSYPEHHRSLDDSPDRKGGSLESTVHIFLIRHIPFK
jgi:hypothetical protein